MKFRLISIPVAILLLTACAKKSDAPDTQIETIVYGHLRYSCSCFDGPGLYYVADSTGPMNSPVKISGSDSILLIGDGHGAWLSNITDGLTQYVDVRTALHGTLTGNKGCLTGQVYTGGCKGDYRVIDSIGFTILP